MTDYYEYTNPVVVINPQGAALFPDNMHQEVAELVETIIRAMEHLARKFDIALHLIPGAQAYKNQLKELFPTTLNSRENEALEELRARR